MNTIDAVLSGIIGLQVIVGLLRGFLNEAVKMGIFLASAAAAYLYYEKGESLLTITLVFFLALLVLHMVFWLVRKLVFKYEVKPSLCSRVGGGIIGACEGAVQVLAILVSLHFLNGILGSQNPELTRTIEASFFYTRYRVMSMASAAPGAQKVYQIAEALKAGDGQIELDEETVNKLRENKSIQAILGDKELLESIRQRDYVKTISNPKFISLLNSRELLKQLTAMELKKNTTAIATEASMQVDEPALKQIENTTAIARGSLVQVDAPARKQTENYLTGIAYSQRSAVVIINGRIYKIGSQVLGGRIVEINSHSITMEFPDGRKQYSVGDGIP